MDQKFPEFWKENERKLWRLALKMHAGFYSRSQGAWEDAFEEGSIRIWEKWDSFKGDVRRLTWAIGVMRMVFLEGIRKYRASTRIISEFKTPGGSLEDDEDKSDDLENLPDISRKLNESEYQKLIDSIDGFAEECAKQFVKGKRSPFTSSKENVLNVFYKRTVDGLAGKEVTELTRSIEEPGMAENQQTQVVQWMKACIAKRAILAGFGETINEL